DLTRARIGQTVVKARSGWALDGVLAEVAREVADLLAVRGGVMTAAELATALLATRGSIQPEPRRTVLATAVARAVAEAEIAREEPRFGFWRSGSLVLVARDEALADYAVKLGKAADRLAN